MYEFESCNCFKCDFLDIDNEEFLCKFFKETIYPGINSGCRDGIERSDEGLEIKVTRAS